MKKILPLLSAIILFFVFSQQQEARKKIPPDFYLNVGYSKHDILKFDQFLWYMGGSLDIHLNEHLMLGPEINLVTHKFNFERFFLESLVYLNLRLGNFFAGAGVAKLFLLGNSSEPDPAPYLKMNVGLSVSPRMRIKLFTDVGFDNSSNYFLLGAQIGIGF